MSVPAKGDTGHWTGVAGQRGGNGLAGAAFQSRTVLSAPPEAMRCPSGLNATLRTSAVWPVSGAAMGWPVSAFHSRTVNLSAPSLPLLSRATVYRVLAEQGDPINVNPRAHDSQNSVQWKR